MIKLRHYRQSFSLLVLASIGASGYVSARDKVPEPHGQAVIIDHKQAAALAVDHAPPEYPPVAKVNYIQGQVRMEITVNRAGEVAEAHVISGDALLAAAALKAVRQWTYRALDTPSGPSGFVTTVKLSFNLNFGLADLPPQQAEKDFLRQVKPPQIVRPSQDGPLEDVVHMRVLLNEDGKVIDQEILPPDKERFRTACESLRSWTFRPAHWGSLPVASYVEVDVSVSSPSIARITDSSDQ